MTQAESIHASTPSTWGGKRANSGRKAGGRNRASPTKIATEASRHATRAITALADALEHPEAPGAHVKAIAASALLSAALHLQAGIHHA
jgi:hypothetical protein